MMCPLFVEQQQMVLLKKVKKEETLVNSDDVGVHQDIILYHAVGTLKTETFVIVVTKVLKKLVDDDNSLMTATVVYENNHPFVVNTEAKKRRTFLKVSRIAVGDGLVYLIEKNTTTNVDLLKRNQRIYVNHKSLVDYYTLKFVQVQVHLYVEI